MIKIQDVKPAGEWPVVGKWMVDEELEGWVRIKSKTGKEGEWEITNLLQLIDMHDDGSFTFKAIERVSPFGKK